MFKCMKKLTPEELKSHEIDEELKNDYKEFNDVKKLLLLGAGEAGKTTIIKQMKILHINGFSESEKREKIIDIKNNIHECIYDLVTHMPILRPSISFENPENETSANYILSIGQQPPEIYEDEYFDNVKILWNDAGVSECYDRSNEFHLIDCAKYFLDRVEEISSPDYLPSEQDILHCRKKTTIITKVEFDMKVPKKYGGGSQKFWMFDVGGQRNERKKWIHVIVGIDAILFLIGMNDFDQKLREDSETNRLKESIELFDSVWKNRFLMHTSFIVFLNKQDLLKEKIESGKSIGNYFPEYQNFSITERDGNPSDEFDRTKYFIRHQLVSITEKRRLTERLVVAGTQMKEQDIVRDCYYHFTTATDTNNIKLVFEDIRVSIMTKNIKDSGVLF